MSRPTHARRLGVRVCALGLLGLAVSIEAVAGRFYVANDGTDSLEIFSATLMNFTPVGPFGTVFQFGDLAWDDPAGVLYMIDGRGNKALHVVNPDTGAANQVGVHGINDLFGLMWDPVTDTLFASGRSPTGFYSLDRATGAAILIGDPGVSLDSIAYDPTSGKIVGRTAGNDGFLYSIDRQTGAATLLNAGLGFINNFSWANDPDDDFFYSVDWSDTVIRYYPPDNFSELYRGPTPATYDGMAFFGFDKNVLLDIWGTCNNQGNVSIRRVNPTGPFAVVRGPNLDGFVIPSGRCQGTQIALGNPTVVKFDNADANGEFEATLNLPGSLCGQYVQVVELRTCRTSTLRSRF